MKKEYFKIAKKLELKLLNISHICLIQVVELFILQYRILSINSVEILVTGKMKNHLLYRISKGDRNIQNENRLEK